MKTKVFTIHHIFLRLNKRFFVAIYLIFFTLKLSAQINYVDLEGINGGANFSQNFDLDNDGIDDFTIASGNFGLGSSIGIAALNGNAVVSIPGAGPAPLLADAGIDASNNWSSFGVQAFYLNWFNTGFITGNWQGETDRYIGLRFNSGGQLYYAWMRMDIIDDSNWVIYDYAYSTVPNIGIAAGQTLVLSSRSITSNSLKIYSSLNGISIQNLLELSDYELFNSSGQLVHSGRADKQEHTIETSGLARGIYILRLEDSFTGALHIKKFII